jgi:hypothetical protein
MRLQIDATPIYNEVNYGGFQGYITSGMNMNDHGGNSGNIYRFKNIGSFVLNNVPHGNESFRNIHIILHQV